MDFDSHCNPAVRLVLAQAGGAIQLAKLTGIPQRTVYHRVRKCGCFSFEQAKRIAAVFDVSLSGLQEPPK